MIIIFAHICILYIWNVKNMLYVVGQIPKKKYVIHLPIHKGSK